MSASSLAWYRLAWPRQVEAEASRTLARLLAGSAAAPVLVESAGAPGIVEHRLGLPAGRSESMVEQLRASLPGLAVGALVERPPLEATRVVELRLSTRQRPLKVDEAELVSRAVLTALAQLHRGESALVQWQLLTVLPARVVGSDSERAEPLPASVADVLLGRRGRLDAEGRKALRDKQALPVWRAVGRVAVRSSSEGRAQLVLRQLVDALRLASAPGVGLLVRRCSAASVDRFGRSWRAPLRLNTAELAMLAGWPVGSSAELPIAHAASRPLPPSKAIPSRGRVLAEATFPGRERPLALSVSDGLRHLHVLGPTGTGKSTLLLNSVLQDIAADRGVVVIEPKGDLIADLMARVPEGRLEDVVLIDPSDEVAPVGLNPLALDGRSPELVADQLLGMFRSLYASSWGPRTNDILGAALMTLARTPDMTLCALPLLLGDPSFRRRLVADLDDPIALEPFWAAYEAWSEAERTAATAPVLNKIRPFLLRPQLRRILGQAQPRFRLREAFTAGKVVLVNLAKGQLGGEAASLLGSLIVAQLWSAALGRTAIEPDRRRPVFVYVDEFQDYLHLPTDLGDALAQARSLGVGFVLAHQHLAQLDPSIRSAVLANARSRICFQLAAEDARALASGPLAAEDLRDLTTFEVYAQLVAGGAVQPWCSGRSLPPPPPIQNPERVREASRRRYGVEARSVDAEIERLARGQRQLGDDLAPRRRGGGAA